MIWITWHKPDTYTTFKLIPTHHTGQLKHNNLTRHLWQCSSAEAVVEVKNLGMGQIKYRDKRRANH